jgi:hypothetical protein
MLKHVAERLGNLREHLVFIGGTVIDLLITDPAAPAVRSTKDVDAIAEIATRLDYHKLGDTLRGLGFKEDANTEGAPICRWVVDGIKVDVMPTEGRILGFSNNYFPVAMETAIRKEIAAGLSIRVISGACFLATKLDSFADRGRGDFMGSPDMEDVVTVLDGRPDIVDEISVSPPELKAFLVKTFAALLEKEEFLDSLPGHLEFDSASPGRVSIVLERIRTIASIEL